jgi:hypothetical protein
MYYHKEIRGHRLALDVSDQQRCHVTEAKNVIETQVNRKERGRVRYV